jgi:hypothetical protein
MWTLCINVMSDILLRQRMSDASVKLRPLFIIYYITILFQALTVCVLADIPLSVNTVDPAYSHIPSKTVETQIVGGTDATEGEFPYMAAIYQKDYLTCSGVILSSRWVLTEAYCLINSNGTHTSTTFELRVPKSKITIGYGSIRDTTLNRVPINNVWIHPQYDLQDPYHYALALIELSEPLPSNGKWSSVRITPKIVSSGDELIAVGWGYREDDKMSSILQKNTANGRLVF